MDTNLLLENIKEIDKDSTGKHLNSGDLECTELYALFNWISPERRPEFFLSTTEKFLLKESAISKVADEILLKKYKTLIEYFQNNPKCMQFLNLLYIIFEHLPICKRIKTKEMSENIPEKLQEFISNDSVQSLLKSHLLECYYIPTNSCYCYASLYNELKKQEPKKCMKIELAENLYKVLEIEKKAFYSGSRPPEQIMILFHYLIQLFIYFPVTNPELLRKLHTLAIEFRLLPKPYGILADEFIQLIENEFRCPCTALLYKIREDFPAVDIYTFSAKETKYTEPFEAFLIFSIFSNYNVA